MRRRAKVRRSRWSLCVGLALGLLLFCNDTARTGPSPQGEDTALGTPVSISSGQVSASYTGCGGVFVPAQRSDLEQQVVELVNAFRAAQGVPPLKRVPELDNAARYHAADMAQDDYFAHETYDRVGGSLVRVCDWYLRVRSYYPNWWSQSENIAAGFATAQSVMDAWLSSPGHRANLLSTASWEIGVGYYGGSGSYKHYWVQDFGQRSGVFPLIINGDATTTTSPQVSLYIYGEWERMRLRNDDGEWSAWQPFRHSLSWTLTNRPGERTVWAELYKNTMTVISRDTIELNVPTLGGLPDGVRFLYSIPEARLVPTSVRITPRDTNPKSNVALTWSVSADGAWFTVSPQAGTTPASFTITPSGFDPGVPADYSGSVTVTVQQPPHVAGSPAVLPVTLQVLDTALQRVYLPSVGRRSPR
ncbi:MAG: hypothetical protein FJ026_11430 [Chloroflexi bacterium]|nr:hypothetical protein [Chloroflexota bacterium]